jgi:hypothetical protein
MVMADQTGIKPKELIAGVRRDLETVGRYYLETGEEDLAKTAFHLSGLALALEVRAGHGPFDILDMPIGRKRKPPS